MAGEIQKDQSGEWRVVDGEEQHAVWVPISMSERESLIKKAKAEGVNLRYLVANMLRQWVASKELSAADLDAVVGGVTSLNTTNTLDLQQISLTSRIDPSKTSYSTVMCPW